jgi:hypothetical protein
VCQPAASPAPAPTPKPAAPAAPAPAVAKAAIEPAKPRDWRESWGKVEPWKATAQANSDKPAEVVSRRAAPTPVQIDVPSQPDPLKAPEMYRGMAMSARPANSKIPEESAAAPAPRPKHRLFASKRPAEPKPPAAGMEALAGAAAPASPNVPPPTQGGGRAIQLPANEANAFWTPPEPPAQTPPPKFNAFDRDANSPPPQGIPPAMARGPQMPMPPRGPMPMMSPPMPPMPPMMANTGVPDAMGNAFTLAGTRRPIPADFGGTPQESNGFGDAVPQMQGGQGLPPRAYQMGMPAMPGMPGMPRPQMPNMMAMGANPLMSVPPTLVAPGGAVAAARSAGVPQLLTTLKDSLYPSQREWAAEQLSEMNWRMQPQVVNHLMTSAQADPAPTVRAACVHALAHMKVGTPEAAALVTNLKSDRDPRVRQEAEEALGTFGVPGNPPSDSGIQPASHR